MSQSKAYTSLKKVKWVGKGQFIIHKRELLSSFSWRSMSVNCFRLINLLELTYLSTGGEENGHLMATYNQMVKYGIRRNAIKQTIKEAKQLGLIKVKTSETIGKFGKYTQEFTLTYLPQSIVDNGKKSYIMPTNEWKKIKEAGNESDTYISNENDTYEKTKHTKMGTNISNESDTTIYILADREEKEKEVVNG